MKINFALLCLLVAPFLAKAQSSPTFHPDKRTPLILLDSTKISMDSLQKIPADKVAFFQVFKDKMAIEMAGPEAEHGVVYVETKPFAQKRYWKFLSGQSSAYRSLVPAPGADSTIVYILNGERLRETAVSELAGINKENFMNLNIINKEKLIKDHQVSTADWCVVIHIKPKQPF